jgi:hypothetical protein
MRQLGVRASTVLNKCLHPVYRKKFAAASGLEKGPSDNNVSISSEVVDESWIEFREHSSSVGGRCQPDACRPEFRTNEQAASRRQFCGLHGKLREPKRVL